jgi:LPXTG-site transpeptidase (sortase) family protein
MDSQTNTTGFSRGSAHIRDRTAHRRAYLDTYAKRRAGIQELPEANSAVAQSIPVQMPIQNTTPMVHAAAVATQSPMIHEDFMQPQPSVDGFSVPTQIAQPSFTEQRQTTPEQSSRKSYLDTLTQRHETAVAIAPAAEETVIEPTLSSQTQTLLDDPVHEARIEANLDALYSSSLTDMIAKNTTSASASHVRTIIGSAVACGVLAVGIFSFMSKYDAQPVVAQPIGAPVIEVESSNAKAPSGTPTASSASAPGVVDASHPVRLVVSSIGVNAPVEGLGTTPEGLIAVPKSYGVVGWYNKSSVPGKSGPAVLVGHYAGGSGAVFDKLKDVKTGDLITTTNGRGESFTYRVIAMNEYNKDQVPMAQIFKSSSDSRLEIITCAGKWQSKNYTNRLVVTAELVK